MRNMTSEEILLTLDHGNWASICTVDEDNAPFAIEATYFLPAENRIGFMINPKGTTMKNISINPKVLLKITFTNKDLSCWLGASFFGTARAVRDSVQMTSGWEKLGKVMNSDYSKAAEKFCRPDTPSPFLEITVDKMTGKCSHRQNEPIEFGVFR